MTTNTVHITEISPEGHPTPDVYTTAFNPLRKSNKKVLNVMRKVWAERDGLDGDFGMDIKVHSRKINEAGDNKVFFLHFTVTDHDTGIETIVIAGRDIL